MSVDTCGVILFVGSLRVVYEGPGFVLCILCEVDAAQKAACGSMSWCVCREFPQGSQSLSKRGQQ